MPGGGVRGPPEGTQLLERMARPQIHLVSVAETGEACGQRRGQGTERPGVLRTPEAGMR